MRFKRSVILSLAIAAIALIGVGPFSAPVLDAQGPLEGQHQRMRPLFELAGVVFTDADERNGRLVVGVLDRDIEGLIRARLAILGVRSESVDVIETEPIVQVATLRDEIRDPGVVGGLQIHFSGYLCSVGFNALRNGVSGFVTASHCSDKQGTMDGTQYYQPLSSVAPGSIATEIADPAYKRNIALCPRGRVCRYSDANFSRGATGVSFPLGVIARTTGVNNASLVVDDINGPFRITGEGTAAEGGTANKVGRTTGWTQGTVDRTCVTTGVSGTNIVLICQTFVKSNGGQIVAGGDSGSSVFGSIDGSNVTLLGSLWGGNTSGTEFVYSPIQYVRDELAGATGTLTTH